MFASSRCTTAVNGCSQSPVIPLPEVRGSFIPNQTLDSMLKTFFSQFFDAFDGPKCADIKNHYHPEAICTYSEPQTAINVESRREFIGLEAIEDCWVHKLPTWHDVNMIHWDVHLVNECPGNPWVCVSGSGTVSVETGKESVDEINFSRSFVLAKFGDQLQITNDLLMYLGKATGVKGGPHSPTKTKTLKRSATASQLNKSSNKPPRKLKRTASQITNDVLSDSPLRNPVIILNEYCQKNNEALRFEEEGSGGPSHKPWFTAVAIMGIGDKVFPSGEGATKKLAKQEAARLALAYLHKEMASLPPTSPTETISMSSDSDTNMHRVVSEPAISAKKVKSSDSCRSIPSVSSFVRKYVEEGDEWLHVETKRVLEESFKHPVSLVLEYCSKNRIPPPLYQESTPPEGGFSYYATLDGDTFPVAVSTSKKDAKNKAALLMLDGLVKKGTFFLGTKNLLSVRPATRPNLRDCDIKNIFDRIASSVQKKFSDLCELDRAVAETGKVVAGIVLMDRNDASFIQVISIATGNRCILGDVIDGEGGIINDSHAEVVARRGLVRVLFKAIDDLYNGKKDMYNLNILEQGPNNKLQVRSNLSIHLYVNTAPCGDARIFSLGEAQSETKVNLEFNQHCPLFTDVKKHGLIRTKIEKGEGTIPVLQCSSVQTWDGIAGGERLRTLSCSDKILKWNILGLQGTLLSHFLNPMYLDTISIGSLFHYGHMCRALCCRLDGIECEGLPSGYELRHPVIGQAFSKHSRTFRDTTRSVPAAINWNYVDNTVEKIDGQRGLSMERYNASRLSKREFFDRFKRLTPSEMTNGKRYREVKDLCANHVNTQNIFFNFIKRKGYGHWLSKPREEKLFQ